MKATIIGAGIGGLSTAALLAAEGHEVHVFEKNDQVGGKMNIIEEDGFRFDTGPSLLTMPFILDKLYKKIGTTLQDELTLRPLSPICRYFYKDGTIFDCDEDQNKTLENIRNFAPEDIEAYTKFLSYAEDIYHKTADAFIFNPLFEFKDFKNLNLFSFFGIDAFSTVSNRVDSKFKSDYLRKFFKRFTTYNGSSPFLAPATLNVIPHVEISQGGFYITGGLYELAKNLYQLAENKGTTFHFNSDVSGIQVSNKKTSGIIVDSKLFASDVIISNSDATETIVKLLQDHTVSPSKKRRAANVEPSCSGFVLLLGIDHQYDELAHHNLFFTSAYEKEFSQIFDDKIMPDDPTIYIANTSRSNPEHAPENGSNLFVLVNAPYLTDSFDWGKEATNYAKKVISEMERRGLTDLNKHITYQKIITPQDFYDKYASNKGSIYGTSSNSTFSAFVRPRNKYRGIDGLYMVGGSTHPGGGIPLVVQSALNAVELINRYEKI